MKTIKNIAFLLVLIIVFVLALVGCGESDTVSNYIVSDQQYTEKAELESAAQPEQLSVGKDVYASVYFIESPKGMEYTAKWYIDGKEAKTDNQKMPTDKRGVIVFSLEGDKVIAGTLKFEISYDGDILASKELVIAEE
jgi:Tfp pilus assembly protein PilP